MTTRWPRILTSRRFAIGTLLVLLAAFEIVYLAAEHRAVGGFGFSLDDSWIHGVFARNLATGHGYSFNPPDAVSGSTAPLYTALLALWYGISGELVWGAKILGMVGLALTGMFLFLAAERLAGRAVAWLAAALCFVSPALLIASLSGMEIGLALVPPCAGLYAYTRRRYAWMIAVLALGVWLRPEALLLLAMGWLAVPRERKLAGAAIAAGIVLPYFAFNLLLSGFPLPVTVLAKSRMYEGHFSPVFLRQTASLFTQYHWLPLFLLLPLGFVALLKRAWWAALFPAALFFVLWATQLTPSSFHRYLHPALPLLYLALALTLVFIPARFKTWAGAGIALLLVMQLYTAWNLRWTHAMAVQNITDMQVTVARVAAAATDPADVVATNDVGAIGYFSQRPVLDLMGLVSPRRSFADNLYHGRPALLAIFNPWFVERNSDTTFVRHYRYLTTLALQQNIICGYDKMAVYVRDDRFDTAVERFAAFRAGIGK